MVTTPTNYAKYSKSTVYAYDNSETAERLQKTVKKGKNMMPLNDDFDVYIKRKDTNIHQNNGYSTPRSSRRSKNSKNNENLKNELIPKFQKFERILHKRLNKSFVPVSAKLNDDISKLIVSAVPKNSKNKKILNSQLPLPGGIENVKKQIYSDEQLLSILEDVKKDVYDIKRSKAPTFVESEEQLTFQEKNNNNGKKL